MPDAFVMKIGLGNDAMQTPLDVADELRTLADFLAGVVDWPEEGGTVVDRNGNSVGRWDVNHRGLFSWGH